MNPEVVAMLLGSLQRSAATAFGAYVFMIAYSAILSYAMSKSSSRRSNGRVRRVRAQKRALMHQKLSHTQSFSRPSISLPAEA